MSDVVLCRYNAGLGRLRASALPGFNDFDLTFAHMTDALVPDECNVVVRGHMGPMTDPRPATQLLHGAIALRALNERNHNPEALIMAEEYETTAAELAPADVKHPRFTARWLDDEHRRLRIDSEDMLEFWCQVNLQTLTVDGRFGWTPDHARLRVTRAAAHRALIVVCATDPTRYIEISGAD